MVHDNLKREEINQSFPLVFLISVIIIILITNTFTILSQICHLTLWKYDGMRWEILMNTKDYQTASYSDTETSPSHPCHQLFSFVVTIVVSIIISIIVVSLIILSIIIVGIIIVTNRPHHCD